MNNLWLIRDNSCLDIFFYNFLIQFFYNFERSDPSSFLFREKYASDAAAVGGVENDIC